MNDTEALNLVDRPSPRNPGKGVICARAPRCGFVIYYRPETRAGAIEAALRWRAEQLGLPSRTTA